MKIILLTPGTGSFYCGTCMRDNALAIALRRRNQDALMVPMYLPPSLDEVSAAEGAPLFYGGINVYLQQVSPLFRKTPRWIDRLFDSPPALASAAKRAGMTQPHELGNLTLSMLRGEDGSQSKELDRLVEWLKHDGKADAVILSNALLMGLAGRIRRETGAKVICTLHGEDTFLDSLAEPYRTQSWETLAERAQDVDVFIPVSHYYGDIMIRRAKLPPEKVHVVYNGISLEGYNPKPAPPETPTLGFLSRMCPPKGLHTLVDAYILLRKRNAIPAVQLRVAGAQTPGDVTYVEEQKAKLRTAGLENDAQFFPNIDRDDKIAFLQSLTVLSTPAMYGEAFGLYIIEALAAGTPVVAPRHAVFPELLAATGGGILCEPDSVDDLAKAIEELLSYPDEAYKLGAEGQKRVFERFSMDDMASGVMQALGSA
jgi:glycosyltransferase involved in cell wall biosynthesis